MPTAPHPRARLYHQVRTAHLERAAALPPAVILYADKRYDFADELAASLDLVHVRGWRAAWWLLRHPVSVLEINEPLMLPAARATAPALLGLALGRLLGRPRTTVVSYAIENLDPADVPARGPRAALRRRLDLVLARWIWHRLDRIAYGTAAAQDLYEATLPADGPQERTLIWALPAAADDEAASVPKQPGSVLFLGAFTDRKGFPLLAGAWPRIAASAPSAHLRLVGKGALQELAEQLTATGERVRLDVDPPRPEIRRALAESQVLVLPSQRTPRWREQVGLPIVEGLSYGCTIVTTTETGLAAWLTERGHRVLPGGTDQAALAEAVLGALSDPVRDVAAALPPTDGRLAADAWMFR